MSSQRGGALIFVLWVIMILTMIALSLGERSRSGLALTQKNLEDVKAKALAWAGMIDMIDQLQQDPPDQKEHADTLYECGLRFSDGESPQKVFHHTEEGGTFDIAYSQDNAVFNGPQDEERRLNLNALNEHNITVFSYLARLSGLDEDRSNTLTKSILDRACEGRKFGTTQELLFMPGMSQEIYGKLKDRLTVYPKSPLGLSVNINTAPRIIVQALTRSWTDDHISVEDADRLTDKIMSFRAGDDGREGTMDDKAVEFSRMDLDTTDKILAERLSGNMTHRSNYLRIRSQGTCRHTSVTLEAIVYRPNLSIVAWHRE